jgi:poly-gamma-glutamate capsule biosynthesis protein CapA/YwtB (metallophosphatase superfamily)
MKEPLFYILLIVSVIILPVSTHYSVENSGLEEKDSLLNASIAVVGDLMCHSVQYNYSKVSKDSFDFRPVYRYVKDITSSVDLALGNLETVTAGREEGYSGYPFFNSPDEFINALSDAGFDLLITSNNHSLDKGETGVLRTIEQISQNNMGYIGTFRSQRDRDSIRIFNVNGIKLAFLSYSYGTNGIPIPQDKDYIVNIIDTLLIKRDITSAKLLKPDIIIVYYHFGVEYKRNPSSFQKTIVSKTIDYGADIILGGHPHVIQPAEYFKSVSSNLDSVFVIYSMGNFISNQRWRYSDTGLILVMNFSKNNSTGEVSLKDVSFTPTWVFKGSTKYGNEFVILPEDSTLLFDDITLSKKDSSSMIQAFKDTKDILSLIKRQE